MFFVEARYHRNPNRAAAHVRYIAHREEGLTDGQRRELNGIGERYRLMRGDEPAIRKALREDGQGPFLVFGQERICKSEGLRNPG